VEFGELVPPGVRLSMDQCNSEIYGHEIPRLGKVCEFFIAK